ncbi:MAG: hypothetical protein H6667_04535 [Ardenticatenaceae bacterium]|nr:hypothetical protein [Ardenticatenaceae bacterium]
MKLLAFVPLVIAWRQNRSVPILGLALFLGLWVLWLYWRARRVGYKRFVAGETAVSAQSTLSKDEVLRADGTPLYPISPNQHILLKASGIFGVADREEQILLKPAEYWQVPLGDHTVMVQPEPGRFLYQFFNSTNLQNLQTGWLICGLMPLPVLAVTFYSVWGQEQLSLRDLYQGVEDENRESKLRTVYLYFDNKADETAVHHTILYDAREKRK